MSEQTLTTLGHLFLALSDKTRLRLLKLMAGGEVSVGFLAESLGESQPKISRHLAYLRSSGVVSTRRDGKWIYYAIAEQSEPAADEMLLAALRSISGEKPERPKVHRESRIRKEASVEVLREDEGNMDNISAEPYMMEWQPAEIDVFLL